MKICRKKIRLSGIVQGVGFRPFVFRLANTYNLAGFVLNDSNGLLIEVEGRERQIANFVRDLPDLAPPLAFISAMEQTDIAPVGERQFVIRPSQIQTETTALISPDIAVCDACLKELFDPHNRRYRYPFINCTHCGPRFTITRSIPYDRRNTSMAVFQMCPDCQQEYDDPANRRFHAQPNACAVCGPELVLKTRTGEAPDGGDPIRAAAKFLRKGAIVAIRGLGGFHLCVDAKNKPAVERLRQRKQREEKPLAVMVSNLAEVQKFAWLNLNDIKLLRSPVHPILLVPKLEPFPLASAIAPDNVFVGIMLPYTPVHHLLLQEGFMALVMTSGNLSEEPIAIGNDEALERLGDIADYFLLHNREILVRSDDSVMRTLGNRIQPVRRARGLVPVPIFLAEQLPSVLAVGAELKNTICLTKGRQAFLSQHIGDLENLATLDFFEDSIRHLQKILQIQPEIIAYDLHPEYLASKWAREQSHLRPVGVQHHHAHIAACLAENQAQGPVIGLAMDGTGFGTDGAIWGGEILVADYKSFNRVGHFDYVPMPGAAMAIKEPWRMLFGFLYHYQGDAILDWPIFKKIPGDKLDVLRKMIQNRINTPMTSSLGRLFDAVSVLLGLGQTTAFEGQAAMKLEMVMYSDMSRRRPKEIALYPYKISKVNGVHIISVQPLLEALSAEWLERHAALDISYRFHQTLSAIFCDICERIKAIWHLNTVALSGGCFQNHFLATELPKRLAQMGFTVLEHHLVPPNDGGLALGQAVIAGHQPAIGA